MFVVTGLPILDNETEITDYLPNPTESALLKRLLKNFVSTEISVR